MGLKTLEEKTNIDAKYLKFDYLPLIFIISYLILTYILHFIMNSSKSITLLLFITITYMFIITGYILALNRRSSYQYQEIFEIGVWKYGKGIEKLIIISMLITIISCINNISTFYYGVENIVEFILNPGKAYEYVKFLRNNPEFKTSSGGFGSIISILLTLASGTKYIYLVLSILYWKQFSNKYKILFFVTSFIYLIQAFLIGAMITVAGLLMSSMPIILNNIRIRHITSTSNKIKNKHFRKRKFQTLLFLITTVIVIVFFIGNRVDENSSIFEGFKSLMFYLSHGYIGLEEAISLPFEFTYGFTTFQGITSYFVKYLGINDPFLNSYLVRNESINGWPALSLWSTIYPWLASDFTFFLIPLIMGLISFKFASIWNRTLITYNPYGYLLLGQLFIFWLMIPANNQLFQTLSNSSSFFLILYLYHLSKKIERKKLNKAKEVK